jgi:hypothetical protein
VTLGWLVGVGRFVAQQLAERGVGEAALVLQVAW